MAAHPSCASQLWVCLVGLTLWMVLWSVAPHRVQAFASAEVPVRAVHDARPSLWSLGQHWSHTQSSFNAKFDRAAAPTQLEPTSSRLLMRAGLAIPASWALASISMTTLTSFLLAWRASRPQYQCKVPRTLLLASLQPTLNGARTRRQPIPHRKQGSPRLPHQDIPEVPPPRSCHRNFDDHGFYEGEALPGYHLQPLNNVVVLELHDEPRLAPPVPPPSTGTAHVRALLALPYAEQVMCGVVVAHGPDVRSVRLRDKVVVHRSSGEPLCLDGRRLLMARSEGIAAVLKEPPDASELS
eukprot:GGOE01000479.1.p1 GENE.GGOE01000479.1~~GGOE01000479.1.p1  ORF type:complete len:332 (+),score=44.18 GGOE01000479.1:107-997(+)